MLQAFEVDPTGIMLSSLALFDTSNTRQLQLINSNPLSDSLLHRALLPMKNLHTLTLAQCQNSSPFFHALKPDRGSSDVLICPKLEKLVLPIKEFDGQGLMDMVAERALRGAKLGSLEITSRTKPVPMVALELRKHVSRVVHRPEDYQ
jgi:hypothetical protein